MLGVVSSVGFSLYLAERHYLTQRVQQSQMEIVQFLAEIGREAVSTKNNMLISSYLTLIQRSKALSYAMVIDHEGRILAHTNPILTGKKSADTTILKALEANSLLRQTSESAGDILVDLSLPILLHKKRVATACVGYSRNATMQIVDQTLLAARRRIALATALSLFMGIVFAVLLAYLMARPIKLLSDGAQEIGEGYLDHRIEITSRDELGELAHEFNIMAAKLQELDQLKQDFVSNVTHELRSPLTSLRGYVELLLRKGAGPLNEEQEEHLLVIKNNAMRLARFIDNLLDVAKIESEKIELHPEDIPLKSIAKEMAIIFRPQAHEKKINFVIDIPDSLPMLFVDADKMLEIFTNLISNALKFTPENGQITFSAKKENNMIHIMIQDTGIGIPPSALKNVFNKFEQVKPTQGLVRKTKGTGLGLTIVKGFVEAHDGQVWMESEVDKGATAHITLPLTSMQEKRAETENS